MYILSDDVIVKNTDCWWNLFFEIKYALKYVWSNLLKKGFRQYCKKCPVWAQVDNKCIWDYN